MSPHRAVVSGLLAATWLVAAGRGGAAPSLAQETPAGPAARPWHALDDGKFAWKASGPLVSPGRRPGDPHVCVKDPTIVRYQGRWHLFATVRAVSGKVDIEYSSFGDWSEADKVPRQVLNLHDKYYCAPQSFYFRPHRRWYLVYQIAKDDTFGPGYSTTAELSDPKSWSKPRFLIANPPRGRKWLDFWIICDEAKAHLFYTSLAGEMFRCETALADFPTGWTQPVLALRGDIFEASHTYRLRGMDRYLTIVEAQGGGRRYYKAYLADRLDGAWKPLADTQAAPFAGTANVKQERPWTANISHGELVRTGCDERMEVDPADVRFLFQGASDAEYRGNPYGKIPWRLGILEMAR
jgi:hypothetical protein